MSVTRQTTTAAISIGLPLASLTLTRSLWKLRTRNEIVSRQISVNGFASHSRASVNVPMYRPNRISTRDSLGFTTTSPGAARTIATATAPATTLTPAVYPLSPIAIAAATIAITPRTTATAGGQRSARAATCSCTRRSATPPAPGVP